jgi:hypothetical protein
LRGWLGVVGDPRSPLYPYPVFHEEEDDMTNTLRRIGRTLSGLVAEDRPDYRRIDVSPARYDDGSWLGARR